MKDRAERETEEYYDQLDERDLFVSEGVVSYTITIEQRRTWVVTALLTDGRRVQKRVMRTRDVSDPLDLLDKVLMNGFSVKYWYEAQS